MNPAVGRTPEQRAASLQKGRETRRRRAAEREARQGAKIERHDHLAQRILEMERKLESLERLEAFNIASAAVTGKALLREQDIVASALPWQKACGVYFLVHEGAVAYVGQSKHVFSRIAAHTDKRFDRCAYVPCPPEVLDSLESLYIHYLQPPLNGSQTDGAKLAPLPLHAVLRRR